MESGETPFDGELTVPGSVLRVLVVEDDPLDRAVFEQAGLGSQEGLEFVFAQDLEESIRILKGDSVDCVLLDLGLPDSSGANAVTRVREACDGEIPVVVLTGNEDESLVQDVMQAGAEDYLLKPEAKSRAVIRTVRWAIDRHRARLALEEANRRLAELSTSDPLTDLLNRRGADAEIQQLSLEGGAAFLIDLDSFKRINDTYGHSVGDLVLQEVSKALKAALRPSDVVARVGGDEFLAFTPGVDPDTGLRLAERVRSVIESCRVLTSQGELSVTASVGCAHLKPGRASVEEAVRRTEAAMSQSKREGKNRVTFVGGSVSSTARELPPILNMVDGEGLSILAQPIVELATMRVVGHELLVRGPMGPLHSPNDLFIAAQHHALLNKLDRTVFAMCLTRSRRLSAGALHINLYPSTLAALTKEQFRDLAKLSRDWHPVCVELSEKQLLARPEAMLAAVARLRNFDFKFGLDDVGHGQSSFEALLVLEPDFVKIDRAWASACDDEAWASRAITRLVVAANALQFDLVAEGVESRRVARMLRRLGVKRGQGFLYGEPRPI